MVWVYVEERLGARVFVGLEFFRDDDLEYVGKSSTVADNTRAVEVLSGLGIDIYASFIVRPEFRAAGRTAYGATSVLMNEFWV